jgi:type IV secretion system protein VirD4
MSVMIAVAAVAVLILGLFWRFTISPCAARSNRARALRWRIRLRLRPGRGHASIAEIAVRWSLLAALFHGRRARPDMTLRARIVAPATDYAVRLGRAQYGKRVFARMEDQTLILAGPRVGKSGYLADRILVHPGAVLCTSTRTDLYDATAAERARLGLVAVFNPQGVGNLPSSFGWNPLTGCGQPEIAVRRAESLIGDLIDGDMAFWQQKACVALAALLHAAALMDGATMADVFAWANRRGDAMAEQLLTNHGGDSLPLLSALAEIRKDGRAADSIRMTLVKSLGWVTIPSVAAAVTPGPGQGFDPVSFAESCGTLYLIAPGGETSPTAPLFRAFTTYIQYEAALAGSRTVHKRLTPPLLLALDEVTQIVPVPLPVWLADGAGKGLLVAAVVHDMGQLAGAWGDAGARVIWATCGTKIFFGGISDASTLENISKLCGSVTVKTADRHGSVPAMPIEVIRQLPYMRALVLRVNLSPVVVKVRPVWKRFDRRFGRRPVLAPVMPPAPQPALDAVPALAGAPADVPEPIPAPARPPARIRRSVDE